MTPAPEKVYFHIGLHKTGTTYLQNMLRANRDAVRAQGIEFTGDPGEPVQAFAVWDLQGRRPRGVGDRRIGGSWDALVRAVRTSGRPAALISEERLSLSTLRQVAKAVGAFPESETHVIVTARDLGRVVVSAWQEEIKNDTTWTWRQYVDVVKDPAQLARNPARGFWLRQDLAKVCETWESAVPADRIHVVTVPPSGSSPDLLLQRFASIIGLDIAVLSTQPAWSNENVGVAATEVIRRVNERMGGRLNQRQHDQVIKLTLVKLLATRRESVTLRLPEEEVPWLGRRADEIIATVTSRGYRVVGDLEELRVKVIADDRRPDDATNDELLEVSLDGLAMLCEKYAKAWWRRKQPDVEVSPRAGGLASRARGVVFRSQRRAASFADSNAVGAKAMRLVLSARDRARIRALGKRS